MHAELVKAGNVSAVFAGHIHRMRYDPKDGKELWFCPNGGDWEEVPLHGAWFTDAFIGTMANVQRFDAGEDQALLTSTEDAYQTMALVEACFKSLETPGVPLALD